MGSSMGPLGGMSGSMGGIGGKCRCILVFGLLVSRNKTITKLYLICQIPTCQA